MNTIVKQDVYIPRLDDVKAAQQALKGIINITPLIRNHSLSEKFGANIFLKREDLQPVRSYKLRGAYNKMLSLSQKERNNGVVCASAGNHAQGVAYSCQKLGIKGTIFMPEPTPKQKIGKVKMFGKDYVELKIIGDTFDDSLEAALAYCSENNTQFIHPFNDPKVIEGQATIGLEILEDAPVPIDLVLVPVGGGGLIAGLLSTLATISPNTKVIAIEPQGAPAMEQSLKAGFPVALEHIDTFVDGAAVKQVGNLSFSICKDYLTQIFTIPEGNVCSTMLSLYNDHAIVVEPAGALSVAALDKVRSQIKGKNVVCILSGSNNDITRMEDIKERSLLYEGLKHYFVVNFPQRAGALKEFVANILGPTDDITHFQYSKKTNRESGPAIVGIELKSKCDFEPLIYRMKRARFFGEYINETPNLYELLI